MKRKIKELLCLPALLLNTCPKMLKFHLEAYQPKSKGWNYTFHIVMFYLFNWEFTTSRSIAAKAWSGFDTKYMKPLLTHSNPTLMETLPSWCNSMARVLTSTEQLSRHPAMMEESAIEQSYASASAEVQNEDNLNKTNNGVKFPETWMWWSIELLLITIITIIIIYQWYLYTLFTKKSTEWCDISYHYEFLQALIAPILCDIHLSYSNMMRKIHCNLY